MSLKLFHLALVLSVCQSASADSVRTVALSGDPAPGTAAGVHFAGFEEPPALNNAGQIAFSARLTGFGVTEVTDTGVWSEGSGGLALVARNGDAAPGTPSGVIFDLNHYYHFPMPVLNERGDVAFYTALTGNGITDANNTSLWSQTAQSLEFVAKVGDPAPGTRDDAAFSFVSGRFLGGYYLPEFNDLGQIAFGALVNEGPATHPYDTGIWAGEPNNLRLVARNGDAAPGMPSGVIFQLVEIGFPVPRLNDLGQTAFGARLAGNGITTENNVGIWSEVSGSIALVARRGDPAPGASDSARFGGFSWLVLNNAGHTAFTADLIESSVNESNDLGIWSDRTGSLELIIRDGLHAPGTPTGVNFISFSEPALNDAGQIAFRGRLTGTDVNNTNDWGIWAEGPDGLHLIARGNDPAPGTPDGVRFGQSNGVMSFAFNDAGQVAFLSRVTGTDITANVNGWGIWATDHTGQLNLIARIGDVLEVTPGDFRTLAAINLLQHHTRNRDYWFNDVGQVAFHARFTDGTDGIFISNAVAIAEPSTLFFAVGSVAVLACCRRRRRSHRSK